nr:hypothetical protein Iba_chr13cCG9610 [Ipomoea batatas]
MQSKRGPLSEISSLPQNQFSPIVPSESRHARLPLTPSFLNDVSAQGPAMLAISLPIPDVPTVSGEVNERRRVGVAFEDNAGDTHSLLYLLEVDLEDLLGDVIGAGESESGESANALRLSADSVIIVSEGVGLGTEIIGEEVVGDVGGFCSIFS